MKLDIEKIKKEIERDRLSLSEQKILAMKICRRYKDGSCQIISMKHKHDKMISVGDNPIKSFKGTVCEEMEEDDFLCGFFPIQGD